MENTCKICVGPVIGLVTNNYANILLETSDDINELKCILVNMSDPKKPIYEVNNNATMNFKKGIPKVIKYTNLPECSIIEFFITDERITDREKYRARFHTFGGKLNKFNIVTVSNTSPSSAEEWTNENNLWRHMHNRISKNSDLVDLVLHLGGQVDLCRSLDIFLSNNEMVDMANKLTDEMLYKHVDEMFRECYRQQWNLPYVRDILATSQNIMFRNLNETLIDYDISKWTSKINKKIDLVKCAHKIYCEYQLALREGMKCFKWDKYGLFLFDAYCQFKPQIIRLTKFIINSELDIITFCSNNPYASCGKYGNTITSQISSETDVKSLLKNTSESETTSQSHKETWPSRNKNMYYVFRYLEKWQRNNNKKKLLSLSTCDCDTMSGSKLYVVNNNAQHGLAQYSFGPLFGALERSPLQTKYKRWLIQQTPIKYNNYGIIKFFMQDGMYIVNIETVTGLPKQHNEEYSGESVNDFKSSLLPKNISLEDELPILPENIEEYLQFDDSKKVIYEPTQINIIEKQKKDDYSTEPVSVNVVEKKIFPEHMLETPSELLSMNSRESDIKLPVNAKSLMLETQSGDSAKQESTTKATHSSVVPEVIDEGKYNEVLRILSEKFGHTESKGHTTEIGKLQDDVNGIIKQLKESRMNDTQSTTSSKLAHQVDASTTDKEVDIVLNNLSNSNNSIIKSGGNIPKYFLI
jgi:hypothetical protein